ncbi:MAG: M48 family metallopeptidase [Blautia sp.]|nr:M48 family metallopeptidase [Lachnoclostridium sp.]MCM1212093.1 M48 family metallopeptidase [Blautia sp.]
MEQFQSVNTPLSGIDCSFGNYLTKRKMMDSNRMDGNGIPNYAFAMDYECRKKLDSIPRFYDTAKMITSTNLSRKIHEYTRTSMAAGPSQFPEIYQISCDCAKTLGIGIPNVFIDNNPVMNAFTYAMDDVEPMVVINSGLIERMNLGELKYIIGHECGHIQNYHSSYSYLSQLVLNTGLNVAVGVTTGIIQLLASLMTVGSMAMLSAWNRASEVTADRAGMLCADCREDCYSALAKLMYGGVIGDEQEIDFDAIRAQLEHTVSSVAKYSEILDSHPAIARRIAALQEFCECEKYYEWRPDQKTPGQLMRTKSETDERCKRYIDLSKNC